VVLLAPLGSLYPIFAVAAIPAFALLTGLVFLKPPERIGTQTPSGAVG